MRLRVERLERGPGPPAPIASAALQGKLADLVCVRDRASMARPAERLAPDARARIAERLRENLAPLDPPEPVRAALERIARPGTALVVTGQQPGFLCSPLYNLYKALTALRLAEELEREWGSPVVALFWNHADDADLAEVHHAFVQNVNLDLQKVGLAGMSSGRLPFSRVVLSEEKQRLAATAELLRTSLPAGAHLEQALALFLPRDGETLARAFTRAMTGLLGGRGLVLFEPDWLREQLSAALAVCVRAGAPGHLAAGAAALRVQGFEPAIEPTGAALLFRVDDKGRRAIRSNGAGLVDDGATEPLDAAQLAVQIEGDPAGFSPGALLRPLAQDLALPIAAYVGGEGELAYHAELGPLRRAVGAPATPFALRASCTLIDAETTVALAKLELALADVLADRTLLAPPAGAEAPDVVVKLRELGRRHESELNALRAEIEPLDPGLAQSLKKTAWQARQLVDEVREKAERVHQNASGKGKRHLRRVENMLFPRELPQERVLGPFTFVARWGTEWIDVLRSAIDPFDRRHLALIAENEEPPAP